jgi:molybdenum cofactor cytidylyltransferase
MQNGTNEGMPLAKALRVERGDVVSFVGGGGKTSSMFRLAAELKSAGFRVLTTTTTHISEMQARMAPTSIGWDELRLLKERLDQHGHCLLIGPPDGKGRVFGASSEIIEKLRARPDIDVILIEADGSRSRPFKAPGEHEPVVPEATTILVPIAGLNSIGQPLDEDHAHRSEIIASLTQQPLGTPITATTLARVLSHPRGGGKQLPAGARLVPLLNKADTYGDMQNAAETAEQLLTSISVDTVVMSSLIQDPPVRQAWVPVAGIILAAGLSSRYGETKQALPWGDKSLVAHAAREALHAGLDPVVVVLGWDVEVVEHALTHLPVHLVFNPDFRAGQSTSIRKGLDALAPRMGAALFILADQPLVKAPIMRSIIDAHRRTFAAACVPVFEERRGNPVLFDKTLFGELRELRGDIGGRAVLDKYGDAIVSVPAGREVLLDIDTPEDYKRLKTKNDTDFTDYVP